MLSIIIEKEDLEVNCLYKTATWPWTFNKNNNIEKKRT
jgi:hypothetical protein